jgi:hypothetical protein
MLGSAGGCGSSVGGADVWRGRGAPAVSRARIDKDAVWARNGC